MATLEVPERIKPYRINRDVEPKIIVIGCVDPWRVHNLFRFISEGLGLKEGEFVPLLRPGAILSLCASGSIGEYRSMRDELEFYFKHFPSIRTVVGITHDECGGYQHALDRQGEPFLRGMCMRDLQIDHLENKWSHHVKGVAASARPSIMRDLRLSAFHMQAFDEDPDQVFFREVSVG